MNVKFSNWLDDNFSNFDESVQLAVFAFMAHIKTHGFKNLKGRNKSSADLTNTTKKGRQRAKFAQKHCLWHYHLGVPTYTEQANGDFTSEMILHYMRFNEFIVLVDIGTHPPFVLPDIIKFNYT